ncbi:MAG: anti-sigma factor family protein [Ruminococcus sp.]|jgi:predicted anti-sigma-YlaC factor YlaD
MNCQKAQDCMKQYLDGTISDYDLEEFTDHIKSCPECYGDLEIYYVMDMAQQYLKDESKEESYNICQMLENDMENKLNRMHRKKRLRNILFLTFMALAGLTIWTVCLLMGYI